VLRSSGANPLPRGIGAGPYAGTSALVNLWRSD